MALKDTWGIALLAVLVMGGIYTGVFTPTEAGAVGAFGAFTLALVLRKLSWQDLREVLVSTPRPTAGSCSSRYSAADGFGIGNTKTSGGRRSTPSAWSSESYSSRKASCVEVSDSMR